MSKSKTECDRARRKAPETALDVPVRSLAHEAAAGADNHGRNYGRGARGVGPVR